ncbi:MAG: signal recognition particle-docking protein FtsY [Treponema sp.]|nr:signal recognition particle-docking protein FtsY [Treponema sp.]
MKFGERLKNFFSGKPVINDELADDLCDLLIEGDFGAAQAYKMTELLKERCKKDKSDNLQQKLAQLLIEELDKLYINKPAHLLDEENDDNNLTAILLLGVNGVGKTTTAAKLCSLFNIKYNKKSILAAADTFRAAAIDQLKIHGQKLDMRVVAHKQGGDPAAVVYDALEAAISSGASYIIADTAGRMHTKSALVEELRKIDRVVESRAKDARYLKFLVLDATTGRNAFSQAEIFNSAISLDGVILTKYDSTAKGGVIFSLAEELRLPVVYICTGEKYADIERFNHVKFANEFAGTA